MNSFILTGNDGINALVRVCVYAWSFRVLARPPLQLHELTMKMYQFYFTPTVLFVPAELSIPVSVRVAVHALPPGLRRTRTNH